MNKESIELDFRMIEIPKGKIMLRDDRVKKQWLAPIQSFLLAEHLITQELYLKITGNNPSTFKGASLPVETISWRNAIEFCNSFSKAEGLNECYLFNDKVEDFVFDYSANGYRLPTEAEWEYACKAGTTGIRYGEIDEIAWYKDNAGGSTHEVGKKEPNDWGLFDMLGNVWEWCTDIYDETVYGSYRIIRGGGWCDEARSCMATNRRRSHPRSFKIDDLGFRIAKNL